MTGWLAAAIVPVVVAWLLAGWMRGASLTAGLADRPNERSLHDVPRRRVGGLALMLAALPVAAWFADDALRAVLACAALLCALSVGDDIRSLPALPRLAAHLAAAAAAVLILVPSAGWSLAVTLAVVLAIAWMTNLFNFMDGSDGLAGGMALIGFVAYAVAARGTPALALTCAAFASASAGFLAWNLPPARVFMGDAGSIPLGYLAGALGLAGFAAGAWPAWFPVVVFGPFIVDASLTFARRVVRREPFWRAHRSHAYQRLVLGGWSHRRLAIAGYAAMAGGVATAFLALGAGPMLQCGIIVVWAAVWCGLLLAIEHHLRRTGRRDRASGNPNG